MVLVVDSSQVVVQAVEALSSPMDLTEHAVLRRAGIAQLAASVAVAAGALEPCPTSDAVRDRTCRRPLISTWVVEVISMPFAQGGILHASLPLAAC